MSKEIIKKVNVEAGVNSGFLENTLTTDISVLESILDLIDNSIDAARDMLLNNNVDLDAYHLPKSYSGYSVHLRLGEKSIGILDNCGGIDEKTLKTRAFKIADVSSHKFGIGHYGIGLKRALLKFGKVYGMASDNGQSLIKMRFNSSMIGMGNIEGLVYNPTGKYKTLFIVSNIKSEVRMDIEREDWFNHAIGVLELRYAIYIQKGFKISISSSYLKKYKKIEGYIPLVRKDCAIKPVKEYKNIDGVNVYIDSGVHEKYYFSSEPGHNVANNTALTSQFGLYYVCNDRVIVGASKAKEYGWKTGAWHSEYNGFVAVVRYVSEDSTKMPWNTIKTSLRVETSIFLETKEIVQDIADQYKASARKIFHKPKNSIPANPPVEISGGKVNVGARPTAKTPGKKTPINIRANAADRNSKLHINNWDTLLPEDFPCSSSDHVLDAFIIEATKIRLSDTSCASVFLLRAILEKTLRTFIQVSGNYERLKKEYFEKVDKENVKNGKTPASEEFKDFQGLTLDMMLKWLSQRNVAVEIFGSQRAALSVAVKNASTYQQKINGVVHGNSAFDESQARNVRNEIYQLLLFCVERIYEIKVKSQ